MDINVETVEPPSSVELISEAERIRRLGEAKKQAKEEVVTVDIDGEEIKATIEFWQVDFRTERQKEIDTQAEEDSPVGIFCPGFGQMEKEKEASPLERQFAIHAASKNDGYGRFCKASVKEIVPATRKEREGEFAGYQVDAQLILKNLPPLIETKNNLPALRIYGYSEGAGVATSLAAILSRLEREKRGLVTKALPEDLKGRHNLNLFTLSGIGNVVVPPEKASQAISLFTKEVGRITLEHITTKFPTLAKKISSFRKGVESEEMTEESPLRYLKRALKDVGISIGNLWSVVRRFVDVDNLKEAAEKGRSFRERLALSRRGVEDIKNQLGKIIRRNPDCDKVNDFWEVLVRTPTGDSLYNKRNLLEYLQYAKSHYQPERYTWKGLEETIALLAFPYANNIEAEMVGDIKGDKPSLEANHHMVEKQPERFLLPD